MPGAHVEYCGERYDLDPRETFHIGRHADLHIDDNRYLHRRFLSVYYDAGLWWLANDGERLHATAAAGTQGFQAVLTPGTRLPLVFGTTIVVFSAGPTTYELAVHTDVPVFRPVPSGKPDLRGDSTIGAVALTQSQLALIAALAEPMLVRDGVSASAIPSSAEAAARLGWPLTKFNRKLDNICEKFGRLGVSGLRGEPGKLATNRRVRLVEFAVASRLVTRADLGVIEEQYGVAD